MKCSGTVKMLIDLELLAHTDYLVASDHSRWSKVLQYMRYILYGALLKFNSRISNSGSRAPGVLSLSAAMIPMCPVGELVPPARRQASTGLAATTSLCLPEHARSGMLLSSMQSTHAD